MTIEELVERLEKLSKIGDTESAHSQADDALLEYINDARVAEAFDNIDRWYA